jgi:hypothetical protein
MPRDRTGTYQVRFVKPGSVTAAQQKWLVQRPVPRAQAGALPAPAESGEHEDPAGAWGEPNSVDSETGHGAVGASWELNGVGAGTRHGDIVRSRLHVLASAACGSEGAPSPCPIRTRPAIPARCGAGGTRRVRLVREEGRDVSG